MGVIHDTLEASSRQSDTEAQRLLTTLPAALLAYSLAVADVAALAAVEMHYLVLYHSRSIVDQSNVAAALVVVLAVEEIHLELLDGFGLQFHSPTQSINTRKKKSFKPVEALVIL